MDGEVLVNGFGLRAVVPMVKLRRRHDPPERAEVESDVGVYERRLNAHERDVRHERGLGEPEDVDRHIGQSTRDRHVNQVQPRTGEPVHNVGRVMNPVEPPQHGYPMKCAMQPVLNHVCQHKNLDKLQDERLG